MGTGNPWNGIAALLAAMNAKLLNVSADMELRLSLTINFVVEKTRSEGAELAGIANKSLACADNNGNCIWWNFHHSRILISNSFSTGAGRPQYLSNSSEILLTNFTFE